MNKAALNEWTTIISSYNQRSTPCINSHNIFGGDKLSFFSSKRCKSTRADNDHQLETVNSLSLVSACDVSFFSLSISSWRQPQIPVISKSLLDYAAETNGFDVCTFFFSLYLSLFVGVIYFSDNNLVLMLMQFIRCDIFAVVTL